MGRDRRTFQTSDRDIEVVVTDDGSRTLRFTGRPVSWHSESGAISESRLVFLTNSGVAERLNQGLDTNVFELGFGTGLNFWLTASLAMKCQARLNYVTVEPHPIQFRTLELLDYSRMPECQVAYQRFAKSVFHSTRPELHLSLAEECVELEIFFSCFESSLEAADAQYDAIFFDPFAPAEAPNLWEARVFDELFQRTKTGGKLVTYCVKSSIQKVLTSVGFVVSKTPGPQGGKREVLIAHKPEQIA